MTVHISSVQKANNQVSLGYKITCKFAVLIKIKWGAGVGVYRDLGARTP